MNNEIKKDIKNLIHLLEATRIKIDMLEVKDKKLSDECKDYNIDLWINLKQETLNEIKRQRNILVKIQNQLSDIGVY